MNELTEELPRKVVTDWRSFAATPSFQKGIDWLRHNKAPICEATTEVGLVKSAIGWGAYHQALKDVEDVLTYIPAPERSIEEPGLNV